MPFVRKKKRGPLHQLLLLLEVLEEVHLISSSSVHLTHSLISPSSLLILCFSSDSCYQPLDAPLRLWLSRFPLFLSAGRAQFIPKVLFIKLICQKVLCGDHRTTNTDKTIKKKIRKCITSQISEWFYPLWILGMYSFPVQIFLFLQHPEANNVDVKPVKMYLNTSLLLETQLQSSAVQNVAAGKGGADVNRYVCMRWLIHNNGS